MLPTATGICRFHACCPFCGITACRAPPATAAVGPPKYDISSAGSFVGISPPGAILCINFGSMRAIAEMPLSSKSPPSTPGC